MDRAGLGAQTGGLGREGKALGGLGPADLQHQDRGPVLCGHPPLWLVYFPSVKMGLLPMLSHFLRVMGIKWDNIYRSN